MQAAGRRHRGVEAPSSAKLDAALWEIRVACADARRALCGRLSERLLASHPAVEQRIAMVIEIPSPCIGVCRMDPATGLCAGCMRTLDEIAAWPRASHVQRLQIVEQLRARRRAAGRTSVADSRPRRRHQLATG